MINNNINYIKKEENIYYNKKIDELYNMYEERSYQLDLYNTAINSCNNEEILLRENSLKNIEEKLKIAQEEAIMLEQLIKMLENK